MEQSQERAILVALQTNDEINYDDVLAELKGLAEAAGCEVVGIITQNRDRKDPATYIGKGKVEEVAQMAAALEASLIIFDDELNGSTLRNLSELLELPVIDRTNLILDIFATRSRTALAKSQVELAQHQYRRSRLIGLGMSMSQQGAAGGGSGTRVGTRGPGETKLEMDRRHIDARITELKRRIREQGAIMETQRKKRKDNDEMIVALVGYTNAGKSSIMNWFLKNYEAEGAEVFEKDMLFATLDTFVRRIELDANQNFLLVDTVGFVNKLPHQLIEAFKATLDEVRYADLLIHVLDSNAEAVFLQEEATQRVLAEIGADHIPMINVLNKWDLPGHFTIDNQAMPVSAKTGEGMKELVQAIQAELFKDHQEVEMFFPFEHGSHMSRLLKEAVIISQEHEENGTRIRLIANGIQRERYKEYLVEKTE